jgi:hypothetical protein
MDLLKSSKRRTLLSEIVYYGLNISLAFALFTIVVSIGSPLPAFAVVLLSKWRVFAVRPRYWASNIKANLVDTIVGLSTVILLYAANDTVLVQLVLTCLYIGWLLFIKPRSKRIYVTLQASIALFMGTTALMTVGYNWPSSLVVIVMWLIGYSTARHLQTSYEEPHRSFYSLVWGLVVAEIGWIGYHWNFAYSLPGFGNIKLSQTALLVLVISFMAERIYSSYREHDAVRSADVLLPVIFSIGIILAILLFFNTFDSGTI